ncbi:LysR family transcriptional regulator [Vibrio algivorus]|uniref:HTH lysR-type domain-containing protein n=1 Tax=Vibrio algivorus TaxID=1667024 RepID=A0ABQ6EM30_9VIBR|nr:LysR family transcriptional regulator [Vibrio algivorus]GLT13816.1 hypothetical protein GCM10007931_07900 [Vibrio algivorus]
MERRIDLNLLQTTLLLCRLKSLKLVALKLGMTESAISKHVSKLQNQLGKTLFERTPTGLEPTAYTKAILPNIEQSLRQINQTLLQEKFQPNEYRDKLSIALPITLLELYSCDIFQLLRKDFPNAEISIVTWEMNTIDAIESGDITFGIHYSNKDVKSSIYQKPLIKDEILLVIGEQHSATTWEEVKDWPFIRFLSSGWNHHKFHYFEFLKQLNIEPSYYSEIDSVSLAWQLLQKDRCAFFTPGLSSRPHCKVIKLPDELQFPLTLSSSMRLTNRTNPLQIHLHNLFYKALQNKDS